MNALTSNMFEPLAQKWAKALNGGKLPAKVTIDESDSSWNFGQPLTSLEITFGTMDVSVLAADVGSVNLEPYTDGFSGTFIGDVGSLMANDVWNAGVLITGGVDTIDLNLVNHFNIMTWGDVGSVNIESSWNSNFDFSGIVENAELEAVTDSTLAIGVLEEDLYIEESVGLDITVYNGHDADIEIASSADVSLEGFGVQGATIGIFDSVDTEIEVHYGDAYYYDHGTNTTIKDGTGNSTFVLNGDGTVLANGQDGNDIFYVGHDGAAILAGGDGSDTFIFETPGQTDATILDFNPSEGDVGLVWLGQSAVDLESFMNVFGSDNGDGSSTAEIGTGSITTFEPTTYEYVI